MLMGATTDLPTGDRWPGRTVTKRAGRCTAGKVHRESLCRHGAGCAVGERAESG